MQTDAAPQCQRFAGVKRRRGSRDRDPENGNIDHWIVAAAVRRGRRCERCEPSTPDPNPAEAAGD
ncbi:hypothetical protein EYF80_036444 [Liparis tanakae]|uniref:Uncharacterized protein n=1 Tax=Liparis tanakae TaxID=230148 RepID=A0A4Z2GIR5_9TELE|nr:hypothetical protein EYF80_036444 [Liparis tanakae]